LNSHPIASPLARLFPNPAVLDVLALLFLNPETEFYQREIAQRVGCTTLQAQRALARITDAGLLHERRTGQRVYYRARREHPVAEELKGLALKSVGLGERLRVALEPYSSGLRVAFIFGSVAAGTEGVHSDVDLLCVGDLSAKEAAQVFGPLGRELQREFNPLLFSVGEFRQKRQSDNSFLKRVLDGPKIWLIGDDDELADLAG